MLRRTSIGIVLAVIALFSLFALLSSDSFQECKARQSESYSEITRESLPKFALVLINPAAIYSRCAGLVAYEYRDALTAIATVFIALFTLTLWLATKELWKSGQRIFEATERAFVFLDGFDTELSTGEDNDDPSNLPERYKQHPELYIARFAILPRWKNGGNTPTKKMTVQVNWNAPGVTPSFKYGSPPKLFFLAPKAAEQSDVVDIPPAPALVDWSLRPVAAEPLILIWGRADYEDIFGRKHFIEWCYRLRFSRPWRRQRLTASFIQWGDYNRSDESA